MGIKEIIQKVTGGKQRREEYEQGQRVAERYQEKKLSSNERELMKIREQQRQTWIKRELETHRKKEEREFMSGRKNNAIYLPNVLTKHQKIFTGKNIFNHKSVVDKWGR